MDLMMRNRPSVLAQLASRCFPSGACSARGLQGVPQLASSSKVVLVLVLELELELELERPAHRQDLYLEGHVTTQKD
jgi:hypothetical protein